MESKLGLSVERLRDLSLLLGGDYTDGVHGVGIVNGMEIIEVFKGYEDLKKFAQWAKHSDLILQKNTPLGFTEA